MCVFIRQTFTIQTFVLITYDDKYFQPLYLILPIRLKIVIYFILFNLAKGKKYNVCRFNTPKQTSNIKHYVNITCYIMYIDNYAIIVYFALSSVCKPALCCRYKFFLKSINNTISFL